MKYIIDVDCADKNNVVKRIIDKALHTDDKPNIDICRVFKLNESELKWCLITTLDVETGIKETLEYLDMDADSIWGIHRDSSALGYSLDPLYNLIVVSELGIKFFELINYKTIKNTIKNFPNTDFWTYTSDGMIYSYRINDIESRIISVVDLFKYDNVREYLSLKDDELTVDLNSKLVIYDIKDVQKFKSLLSKYLLGVV